MTLLGWTHMRLIGTGLLAGAVAIVTAPGVLGRGVSGSSGKIAFEGDGFSPWGLSVMRPDGSDAAPLDAVPGAADASWSPNGRRVAFEADPNNDGNLEIFVMDADGSNLVQLTESPGRDYWADWFPDGRRIAFTSERSGIPQIYVMNADGSDEQAVTDSTEFAALQPDVSPDGRRIVFHRESRIEPPTIWVIDVDGSNPQPLTLPQGQVDTDPQWSPNGQSIVFSSNRGGTFEIYVMQPDGSSITQLTASAGGDFNPTFSPDGQQIAWWKFRNNQGDIWTMNLDGSDQVNVTNSPAFEGFPDWHQGNVGN